MIVTNTEADEIKSSRKKNVLFQHWMVLDYLLAEEGRVCGKLNDSNCCLQIDNNGKR